MKSADVLRGIAALIPRARAGDLNAFCALCVRDDTGRPLDMAPIHVAMSACVDQAWKEGKYAGVLGPWRHGKSRSLIIGRAALEVGLNHNVRIRIICADDREAVLRVSAVRRLIESPRYQRIFPDVKPLEGEWLKQQFIVQRLSGGVDPTVAAAGVFAAEAGGGHDIIMIDDVVTYQNAYLSPATRGAVYETLSAVWLRRIDPGTRVIAVGTAWHYDDAYHRLRRDQQNLWKWLIIRIGPDFTRLVCSVD